MPLLFAPLLLLLLFLLLFLFILILILLLFFLLSLLLLLRIIIIIIVSSSLGNKTVVSAAAFDTSAVMVYKHLSNWRAHAMIVLWCSSSSSSLQLCCYHCAAKRETAARPPSQICRRANHEYRRSVKTCQIRELCYDCSLMLWNYWEITWLSQVQYITSNDDKLEITRSGEFFTRGELKQWKNFFLARNVQTEPVNSAY